MRFLYNICAKIAKIAKIIANKKHSEQKRRLKIKLNDLNTKKAP